MAAMSSLTGVLRDGDVRWTMKANNIILNYTDNGKKVEDVLSLIPGPDGQFGIRWRGSDGGNDIFTINKSSDRYKVWDAICITLLEGGDLEDVVRKYTTHVAG